MLGSLLFACSCVAIFFGARATVLGCGGASAIAALATVVFMLFVPFRELVSIAAGVVAWRTGQARYLQRVVDGGAGDAMDEHEIESTFA